MTEKANSTLIGGVMERRDLYIPEDVCCWAVNRPAQMTPRIVDANSALIDPPDVTLFYESGITEDGLRAFVIEGD